MKMNLISDQDGDLYFHDILFTIFKIAVNAKEEDIEKSES